MRESKIRISLLKLCVKHTTSNESSLYYKTAKTVLLDYCHWKLDRLFLHLHLFDPQADSFKLSQHNELTKHRLACKNFVGFFSQQYKIHKLKI